ncbi:MAG: DUF2283 domain-containing protein [Chloroflexi bacterium]|nr:DUF2283 domain-containing protein [Chloroflexota bacterium]
MPRTGSTTSRSVSPSRAGPFERVRSTHRTFEYSRAPPSPRSGSPFAQRASATRSRTSHSARSCDRSGRAGGPLGRAAVSAKAATTSPPRWDLPPSLLQVFSRSSRAGARRHRVLADPLGRKMPAGRSGCRSHRRVSRKRVGHAGAGMRTEYDKEHDAAYFAFSSAAAVRHERLSGLRVIDYGANGDVVGVEFISPSSGVDLIGVPRAEEIAQAARELGLPIRRNARAAN